MGARAFSGTRDPVVVMASMQCACACRPWLSPSAPPPPLARASPHCSSPRGGRGDHLTSARQPHRSSRSHDPAHREGGCTYPPRKRKRPPPPASGAAPPAATAPPCGASRRGRYQSCRRRRRYRRRRRHAGVAGVALAPPLPSYTCRLGNPLSRATAATSAHTAPAPKALVSFHSATSPASLPCPPHTVNTRTRCYWARRVADKST